MDAHLSDDLAQRGLEVFAYAAPVTGDTGVGVREHELVTPASVMKIQVALAVESLIDEGAVEMRSALSRIQTDLRSPLLYSLDSITTAQSTPRTSTLRSVRWLGHWLKNFAIEDIPLPPYPSASIPSGTESIALIG